MSIAAVVEIAPGQDGALPEQLISTAYLASWKSEIVLLLRGVDRDRIDSVLDRVVATRGLSRGGVRYLEDDDSPTVRQLILSAQVVVASSDGLRLRLGGWGVACRSLLDLVPGTESAPNQNA